MDMLDLPLRNMLWTEVQSNADRDRHDSSMDSMCQQHCMFDHEDNRSIHIVGRSDNS